MQKEKGLNISCKYVDYSYQCYPVKQTVALKLDLNVFLSSYKETSYMLKVKRVYTDRVEDFIIDQVIHRRMPLSQRGARKDMGTLAHRFNSSHDSGKRGHSCICHPVENSQTKRKVVKHFVNRTKWFANKSIYEPRCHCLWFKQRKQLHNKIRENRVRPDST